MAEPDIDRRHMATAVRLALRGHGGAEPNPLVGCVVTAADGAVVGWGYHRRCGGPHAEVAALGRAGPRARGATAYVTLEPCNTTGRTGPCTEALLGAGIARVVVGRADPHPAAAGGAARLRAAGVRVTMLDDASGAVALGDPFARRVETGRPWVVAKWAQTIDGRVATRTGASQWISSAASRRLVHRERGRVDAILTGVGTVRADDPLLTARNVRVRRLARRVVVDPRLEIPPASRLVASARDVPTEVVCAGDAPRTPAAARLEAAGVVLRPAPESAGGLDLAPVLRRLADDGVATMLVESGPGLLGRLFRQRLVDEAWVFVAPLLLGDGEAVPCVDGMTTPALADGVGLRLRDHRVRGGDVVLRYRVS